MSLSIKDLHWHSQYPPPIERHLWAEMPSLNRFFSLASGFCLLLALGRTAGPPTVAAAKQAIFPYTREGKQELCATHLRTIAVAMAAYAQDNDGRFPPVDYQNTRGERLTWVSLMRGRAVGDLWECPVGPRLPSGQEQLLSSYVMNPVLAGARAAEMDSGGATLLAADGGDKHDVSLLPPYPTWPSFARRTPSGGLDMSECNFSFRHGENTVAVFADGHADPRSAASWGADSYSWGGSAALRRSRTRLSQSSPQARELFKRVQAGDVGGAASYIKAHRTKVLPVSQGFAALWKLNSGDYTSDSVEEMGWHLARAWRRAGDGSLGQQFNAEQTLRCQKESSRISNWETRDLAGQPGIRYQCPAVWQSELERDGRYQRVYVRSHLPAVYAVMEVGTRTTYVTPQPIDWHGQERDLVRRYGKGGYQRIAMGTGTLGGNTANVWDYEIEKPGSPRLRKRYVGYTDGWTSYVAGATAPAKDWGLWKRSFETCLSSVQTGYLGESSE